MLVLFFPAPSAPPLVLTAEKTSDSLTLSWDPPANESRNGVIQRYVIRILEDDTSTSTDYYSSTTQITVSDLHPYYTYKCSVAAETVGVGPYTAIVTVQLDEDSELSLVYSEKSGYTTLPYFGVQ